MNYGYPEPDEACPRRDEDGIPWCHYECPWSRERQCRVAYHGHACKPALQADYRAMQAGRAAVESDPRCRDAAIHGYMMGWLVGAEDVFDARSAPPPDDSPYGRGYAAGRAAYEAAVKAERERLGLCGSPEKRRT